MFVWVPQPETIGRTSQTNRALAVFIDNPVILRDGSQRVKLVLWSGESGGRAVARNAASYVRPERNIRWLDL